MPITASLTTNNHVEDCEGLGKSAQEAPNSFSPMDIRRDITGL